MPSFRGMLVSFSSFSIRVNALTPALMSLIDRKLPLYNMIEVVTSLTLLTVSLWLRYNGIYARNRELYSALKSVCTSIFYTVKSQMPYSVCKISFKGGIKGPSYKMKLV
ncbi:hypothetical protein FGO68_gene10724 [Halteria grandinella]|uniref:Uncharacterized protein n=1 Tax=Halteria grandinella TaxID=5974 RepID=A0A8J8SWM2_HALGN|nr:hypothetical protein FGO68_gene10724 [Halteria grandinella]